jgi:hypothetical protein
MNKNAKTTAQKVIIVTKQKMCIKERIVFMNLLNDELSSDYPYHDVTSIGAK